MKRGEFRLALLEGQAREGASGFLLRSQSFQKSLIQEYALNHIGFLIAV